jgi:hypothetical protein
VKWFREQIADFLEDVDFDDFSLTKFNVYFSLAETYGLVSLKNELETSFMSFFQHNNREE